MDERRFVVNVQAAVYRDGEYLLARRSEDEDHAAGTLGLVGGKVESIDAGGGLLHRTAAREVREEVGVEVRDPRYVESTGFVADGGARVVNVVLLCRHDGGRARVREPEEVAAVEWVERDAAFELDLPPYARSYLAGAEELRHDPGW